MFLIGEVVELPNVGMEAEITKVELDSISVRTLEGVELTLRLTRASYGQLLQCVPDKPHIKHTRLMTANPHWEYAHPNSTVYSCVQYPSQTSWFMNGKPTSAVKIWKHAYKVGSA